MLALFHIATAQWPERSFAAERFTIDPGRSAIEFRIRHLGITFVKGNFPNVRGGYFFDDKDPRNASIQISARVVDIDTGNEKRDDHLRSPDFFNEPAFPFITFTSRSIEPLDGSRYAVEGTLTLHGVARDVAVVAVKTDLDKDSSEPHRSGFTVRFSIRRSDYGMKYLTAVSNRVELAVRVEGVRVKSQ